MATSVAMSSFQKRTGSGSINISGTKISSSNSGLLVSTGIASLDAVIDGGLPMGSLCLIEEDEFGSFSKMVLKYFLAEGVSHGNYLMCASANESSWEILNSLPSPSVEPPPETSPKQTVEELKIAWRYENLCLDTNQSKSGSTSYDLSLPVQLNEDQKAKVVAWDGLEHLNVGDSKNNLQNPLCNSLLDTISSSISQWNLLSSSSNNLLRVAVPSYGTPEWQFQDQKDFTFTATLLLLKSMLRSANAIALVSIPHHLLSLELVSRSHSVADVVLRLKSLREDRHLQDLMDVHGVLEVKKRSNLCSLKPILGHKSATTYGFKSSKRKFRIEKLHLPPSLESDEPGSATNDQSLGCSSTTSKPKIDF